MHIDVQKDVLNAYHTTQLLSEESVLNVSPIINFQIKSVTSSINAITRLLRLLMKLVMTGILIQEMDVLQLVRSRLDSIVLRLFQLLLNVMTFVGMARSSL